MSDKQRASERGNTTPLSRRRQPTSRSAEPTFSLLVYHRDGVMVVPTPMGVPMTVGRESPADVVVPDLSLSRCHARFTVQAGLAVLVEDLDSTNGTVYRGEPVQRATIRPGDTVELGSVVVSPHMRAAVEPELAGLVSHDAFCLALDAELARARYFGEPVGVLLLQPLDAAGARTHVSQWWRHLRAALRPIDTAALYSPYALEIVGARLDPTSARELAEALVRLAPRSCPIGCGVATYPDCGATTDELLEVCRRAALATTSAASVVHGDVVRAPTSELEPPHAGPVIASAALREIFATIDQLAGARLPVLLQGETGSGKEVLARRIHERSPRAAQTMVCVNCGAIPPSLVESTLFGHKKGAFTGATESSPGVFGSADGGTVLLDEIGELSPSAQVALLRILEEGRMRPVGSGSEVTVDVRVIAATHRDIEAMVDEGSFRGDLFYRLNGFTISLPPLRERPDDIEPLVSKFVADAVHGGAPRRRGLSVDALEAVKRYRWPGNVRELRNAIERAAVIARGDLISVDDLPRRVRDALPMPAAATSSEVPTSGSPTDEPLRPVLGLRPQLRQFEARLIVAALEQSGGNQTEAARQLDIPVRTLADKIQRLDIVLPGPGQKPVS